MLKSIKVLPNITIIPAKFTNYFSDAKGKQKAVEEPGGSHASKRTLEDSEESDKDADPTRVCDMMRRRWRCPSNKILIV